MQLLTLLAGAVVALSALYLLGFGAIAVAGPARALGYLQHCASTLGLHVLENNWFWETVEKSLPIAHVSLACDRLRTLSQPSDQPIPGVTQIVEQLERVILDVREVEEYTGSDPDPLYRLICRAEDRTRSLSAVLRSSIAKATVVEEQC